MKLPEKCPHRRSAKNWRPWFWRPTGEEQAPCCRQTNIDPFKAWYPKAQPMCDGSENLIEKYRFSWDSSFDGKVVVQVERGQTPRGEAVFFIDWARNGGGGTGRYWRSLEQPDWNCLASALLAAGFWALDSDDDRRGFDGARWTIEGRRRDVYRVIRRWSPKDAAVRNR